MQPVGITDRREPAAVSEPRAKRRGRAVPIGVPRLLSAQDAARYLGLPYTTLRDCALRGHLPIVRVPDCRRLWFDRQDLDQALDVWKKRDAGAY
jgi:excisionase family DNA binding protein